MGFRRTLTGFKWISREPGLVFGYEEALGYCVDPAAVRDKDGITAALMAAELAAALTAQGRGLTDALADVDAVLKSVDLADCKRLAQIAIDSRTAEDARAAVRAELPVLEELGL